MPNNIIGLMEKLSSLIKSTYALLSFQNLISTVSIQQYIWFNANGFWTLSPKTFVTILIFLFSITKEQTLKLVYRTHPPPTHHHTHFEGTSK